MDPSLIRDVLVSQAGQLPLLLISLIGCGVALVKLSEAPRPAAWALAGFALSLLVSIAAPVTQIVLRSGIAHEWTGLQTTNIYAALGMLWSILRAVGYGFLLAAAFVDRPSFPAR